MNTAPGDVLFERRKHLETTANPSAALDYLVRLDGVLDNSLLRISIHYVPDKLIVPPEIYALYLTGLKDEADSILEQLATLILDDFNNEVVPRWIRIRLERSMADGVTHQTLLEDRQPKWRNPDLLAQIERF